MSKIMDEFKTIEEYSPYTLKLPLADLYDILDYINKEKYPER